MDLCRESSREQQSLAGNLCTVRKVVENLEQLATEALVEETVGLVEDKSTELREARLHVVVLEQVYKTAGCGDEDIRTLVAEVLDVGPNVGSTDDALHAHARVLEEDLGRVADLRSELARGTKH